MIKTPWFSSWYWGYTLMVYAFVVCFLAASFFLHARGVFLPYWIEEFDVGRAELSLAISITLISGSMTAPFMGYLIDHFKLRIIISCAAVWMGSGYLLMQLVDSYWWLLAILIPFQGMAWTGVGPLVHTKLMVNWFERHRGKALGIAIMGISVAGIFMPPVNAWLAENIGWRDAYLIYAGLLFGLVLPLTILLVRQKPEDIGETVDGAGEKGEVQVVTKAPVIEGSVFETYKEFLTSKAFWSVVLTFGLMNGVYSAMATHLPTYVSTELDFTITDGAYLLTFTGFFAVGGKVVFGWMMDNVSAKLTVMSGVIAYIGSTIALMWGGSYPVLMVATALFGLGFGGMVPVRSVIISRLFGAAKFSRVNGLLSFFLAPAMLWIAITGYIADQADSYVPAFQIWCIAFVLAGIVSLIVKIPDREEAVS